MSASILLQRYGTLLGTVVVFAVFSVTARNFLSAGNVLVILKQISYIAILGIGFSMALAAAELDLSFAAIASLATVVTGGIVFHGYPPILAAAAGLACGVALGIANGLVVTRLKVPSLIATLAMASVANGFAFMVTGGVAFVGSWPSGFLFLGRGVVGGVPVLVLWLAFTAAVAIFFLRRTRTGLHLIFTGEATEAARLSGIDVRRMKVLGLGLSGATAGLVAVLLASSLSSAAPGSAGDFLLISIAAVLLGMTMYEPGRPNVAGTLTGAFTIGMLSNGLVLLGAPYYLQDIALGLIIVASVSLSAGTLTRAAFSL